MPILGKTKQAVVSEFRCAEILEAARRVFARKGFNGSTVDEITEEAGVAKGTLYLYFGSKRDVYLAAVRQGMAKLMDETLHNVDAAPTPAAKIRAFIRTRIRYAEENRDFVKIYHSEFANLTHPAYLMKEFRDFYAQQAKILEEVVSAGSARGDMRPVRPAAAAFAVYEMTRGVVMQRLLGWSSATAEEDVQTVFDLVWKGLAPTPCCPEDAR